MSSRIRASDTCCARTGEGTAITPIAAMMTQIIPFDFIAPVSLLAIGFALVQWVSRYLSFFGRA
jgi:hypothetical protein